MEILQISADPVPSLKAWAEQLGGLPFPLLSDYWPHGAVGKAYGVFNDERGMRGDALGLLHGLPAGIKDLDETGGLLTTYGSPLYRDFVPERDNAMVARVRGAGAVVVGKTNVPEFGAGANSRNFVWGATGNPFDPMLNAGGSSGGSAVALATNMLPLCTGSDTGGSLRIPAAKCGVVGFRPSPGLVPVERRGLGWTPISVVGPMGRTVADTSLLLAAQAALDSCDPLSYPVDAREFATLEAPDLASLRVAFTEDFDVSPVDQPIRKVFREKVAAMRHLFRSCDEVRFDFGEADRCFDVIRAQNYAARYREAYEKDPSSLGPNVRANYEMAAGMENGNTVWSFKTGSSINAPPITYTYKGRQFVTVLSGRGGSNPNRFAGDVIPAGGAVWTFALMPD